MNISSCHECTVGLYPDNPFRFHFNSVIHGHYFLLMPHFSVAIHIYWYVIPSLYNVACCCQIFHSTYKGSKIISQMKQRI